MDAGMTVGDVVDAQASVIALVCPYCGSEDLATEETVLASANCRVYRESPSGKVVIDHEGYSDVHWDTMESRGHLSCRSCGSQLFENQLVTRAETEEDVIPLKVAIEASGRLSEARGDIRHFLESYAANPERVSINRFGESTPREAAQFVEDQFGDVATAEHIRKRIADWRAEQDARRERKKK